MDIGKAKEIAWRTGNLKYLLRKQPVMQQAYEDFRLDRKDRAKGRIWYWNVARQTGKSFSCCLLALEQCLSVPGSQVKYASVDQKQARAIVFPQMERLLEDCPPDLLPKFHSLDGVYYFPHNGSRITIAGADKDNIRKLRGQTCHLGIVDEGAFMGNLKQVVLSVLLPQTTTTKGRLIVATSPPESAGHYAAELAMSCKSRGAYAKFTIDENQLLSEGDKLEILREYGGREATAFRREYLCEFVTDTANAVVPEFTEAAEQEIVVPSLLRPDFYDAYTCLDGGYTDAAGCLFGYVDYKNAKLVVEAEWFARRQLGSDIAAAVSLREQELWGEYAKKFIGAPPELKQQVPYKRVMDIDPSLTAEFLKNHGQVWTPVNKSKINNVNFLQAATNQMNDFIRQRSLVIGPDCPNLVRQLHNAVWDTNRRTWKRDDKDAHYDLVSALMYLIRELDWVHSPFPRAKPDLHKNWFSQEDLGPQHTNSEAALVEAFGFKLPE